MPLLAPRYLRLTMRVGRHDWITPIPPLWKKNYEQNMQQASAYSRTPLPPVCSFILPPPSSLLPPPDPPSSLLPPYPDSLRSYPNPYNFSFRLLLRLLSLTPPALLQGLHTTTERISHNNFTYGEFGTQLAAISKRVRTQKPLPPE